MRKKIFTLPVNVRWLFLFSLIVLSLACSSQRKPQGTNLPFFDATFAFNEKPSTEERNRRIAELESYFRSYVKEAYPTYKGNLTFSWYEHADDATMIRVIGGDAVATGSAPKPPTPPPPPIQPPGEFKFFINNAKFQPIQTRGM